MGKIIKSGIKNVARQTQGRAGGIVSGIRRWRCRHCWHLLAQHDYEDGLTCRMCDCKAFGFPLKKATKE